jgi:hypothetical protein
MIGYDDRFINLLMTVSGDRLQMPHGYFRAGSARINFFNLKKNVPASPF